MHDVYMSPKVLVWAARSDIPCLMVNETPVRLALCISATTVAPWIACHWVGLGGWAGGEVRDCCHSTPWLASVIRVYPSVLIDLHRPGAGLSSKLLEVLL